MPATRGFDITVQATDGTPLNTYGTRTRGNTVYTQIEANEGRKFQIQVKPLDPFPDGYSLRRSNRLAAQDAMDIEHDTAAKRPFEYWCYIYFDGKHTCREDCTVIHVDPEHEHYDAEGEVFQGRCRRIDATNAVYGKSKPLATFKILPWMFTGRGIDVLLDQMSLSTGEASIPTEHDQDMSDIIETLKHEGLSKPAPGKGGQIEVEIRRETSCLAPTASTAKRAAQGAEQADNGNTHEIVALEDGAETFRSTEWYTSPYLREERFFCRVIFHYHDITKLVNLGLCDREGNPTERRQSRILPAPANDPEPQNKSLKRTKGPGHEIAEKMDKMMLSDEGETASSNSDSTSDSDVPRPLAKQRRTAAVSRRRKPKARKSSSKMLSWRAQQTAQVSKSSCFQVPTLQAFDFKPTLPAYKLADDRVSDWLRLESHGHEESLVIIDKQAQEVVAGTAADKASTEARDLDLILEISDDEELIE